MRYFNAPVETMERDALDELIDERIRYTVKYAAEHSVFYRKWFESGHIEPASIREHADLLKLPIISGRAIRENQPPVTPEFNFKSADWKDIFTVHETSGTSGTPKSFFLTREDWNRYADKYARFFLAQGFAAGDRIVVCTAYGMNVGANTMTLAAYKAGITIVPVGKCNFPVRIIKSYMPTGIIGSVFKLLRLGRRMKAEGVDPKDSGVKRLVIGGESFAEESREFLAEMWGCNVYNTYGSTEGTMCGECTDISGLHVPEDMVHMDVYSPGMRKFVQDGECGRMVLTTLLPVGSKCGTLLINYDTEDTTVVLSRGKCRCGRTHMRILNPQREAETVWVADTPFNRVDIERGVFQRPNMEYTTGEYESTLYTEGGDTVLKVNLECFDPYVCDKSAIEENFMKSFFKYKPALEKAYKEHTFRIELNYLPLHTLNIFQAQGRPKRLIDLRHA
jgi:coenzyme F390 synthetase